ncbi:MAG: DUF4388 domain-containing protein [Acidimicrobiales bacterium]
MPLQGTFDVLDFTDVLQLLARQQLTGRLHVRSRSFGANLFLEVGLLVGADQSEHQPAATAGDVRGRIEEVCFEMLEAERGSFEFHPGKPSSLPVGERHQPESVITQARRRLDEWHELQEIIPSLDMQPRLVYDLPSGEVTLDKQRWRMLTAIDGRRNLRAIGRVLNLSDFDVCRVVRSLIDDGVVELEGLAALPASTRDAMPVVPAPDPTGIERVVAVDAETTVMDRPDAETAETEAGTETGETPAVELAPALGGDAELTRAVPTVEPPPAAGEEGGDEDPDVGRSRRVIRIGSRHAGTQRS